MKKTLLTFVTLFAFMAGISCPKAALIDGESDGRTRSIDGDFAITSVDEDAATTSRENMTEENYRTTAAEDDSSGEVLEKTDAEENQITSDNGNDDLTGKVLYGAAGIVIGSCGTALVTLRRKK